MSGSLRTGDGARHLRELRRAMPQFNLWSARHAEDESHPTVKQAEDRMLQAARNLIDWDDQR